MHILTHSIDFESNTQQEMELKHFYGCKFIENILFRSYGILNGFMYHSNESIERMEDEKKNCAKYKYTRNGNMVNIIFQSLSLSLSLSDIYVCVCKCCEVAKIDKAQTILLSHGIAFSGK